MIVHSVSLRNFRSYEELDLELRAGVVLCVGPNGAGKTNLLESLHVGTQGFSPRTRSDAELVRFGTTAGRVAIRGERDGVPIDVELTLSRGQGKRARLNGAPLRAAEQLRARTAVLVFTPDRLAVVKGPPAVRRAYFDRTLGRLFPARAALPAEYAAALAQRNAALRRVSAGFSSREAIEPWTQRVVDAGRALVGARQAVVAQLTPPLGQRAHELGLRDVRLAYAGEPPSAAELHERLARDLERGSTGAGPHLHEIAILSGERDLRSFGSQGEQRLAVLSLLLAESALLAERSTTPPLLLLDDVLSELDDERRRTLARRIEQAGQTLVTTTATGAYPLEPSQVVDVVPGEARSR